MATIHHDDSLIDLAPVESIPNTGTTSDLEYTDDQPPESLPDVSYDCGPIPGDLVFDVSYSICEIGTVKNSKELGESRLFTKARRDLAVSLGIRTFGKMFLMTGRRASRKLQYDVFMSEFILLDDILTNIRVGSMTDGQEVFGIKRKSYLKLLTLMSNLRTSAVDAFIMKGLDLPLVPCWGKQFGINSFLSFSDFEVVGATFRAEVENFFVVLYEQYDYNTGRSSSGRSDGSDGEDIYVPPVEMESVSGFQRDTPPHLVSGGDTDEVRSILIEGVSSKGRKARDDLSGIKRRQAERHRPRDPEERLAATRRQNQLPHNDKIREVMTGRSAKDLGTHQSQDHRERDDYRPKKSSPLRQGHSVDNPEEGDDEGSNGPKESSRRGSASGNGPPDDDSSDSEDDKRKKPERRDFRRRNPNRGASGGGQPPDDDPSDSSDSGRLPRRLADKKASGGTGDSTRELVRAPKEAQFDLKLKISDVPKWNGNTDTLVRWFAKINDIASLSSTVHDQLGRVIPKRLEGTAETWYFSLPLQHRLDIEKDWTTIKEALGAHYMNRRWMDKQKNRAHMASYRESKHPKESPSEYVIRKLELLRTAFTMDDTELIMEIMDGAPNIWNTVLTTQLYRDVVEFQDAVYYHEDTLERLGSERKDFRDRFEPNKYGDRNNRFNNYRNAHTRLVGSYSNMPKPKFPRDDSNVSKKATPASKGARPCRHCGSDQHWDPECKHSYQSSKRARTHLAGANAKSDELEALEEYEDMYYNLESDNEEFFDCNQASDDNEEYIGGDSEGESSQSYLSQGLRPRPNPNYSRNKAKETNKEGKPIEKAQTYLAHTTNDKYVESTPKPPLNRRSRRRLAREIAKRTYHTQIGKADKSLIELRKIMGRPPGCSFLGAKATQTEAFAGSLNGDRLPVIVDSGSDITLISLATLQALTSKPKIKAGQKINLIQVTGKSVISGYVTMDLYFEATQGPVKITVEAYVVKGMTTPFILGNDFADQYSISIIRREGKSYLTFGDSGRDTPVENTTTTLEDEDGHAFRVRITSEPSKIRSKQHRRSQKRRKRERIALRKGEALSAERRIIPPETSASIKLRLQVPSKWQNAFMERNISTNELMDKIYGSPDALVDVKEPYIHVTNFSKYPITIARGQTLGTIHNPNTWLDKSFRNSNIKERRAKNYVNLLNNLLGVEGKLIGKKRTQEDNNAVRSRVSPVAGHMTQITTDARVLSTTMHVTSTDFGLGVNSDTLTARSVTEVSSKAQRNNEGVDDPLAEEPIEGGPKQSEVPEDTTIEKQLLEEIDISSDLDPDQRERVQQVLLDNEITFGINGRLGQYDDSKVEILLKPGTSPISLPPFPASPANREIMDKQMDSWISLGVVEPSKSPWGAPTFITYRNGKPRMVIDFRRLNEAVVPDEFPIPRQEDILYALNGSQWLSTLDALAGFTQLSVSESSVEKLAFRSHRGLWQFKRMPFGYRNGPSVFQRVMQGVLAPYLWIFALVYIDDIVVFSKTFDEHLDHLDQVFKAIANAKITLSPAKCHLAYQSVLLLGQKVSRLGLSTHKEKVDAIVNLGEPQNKQELQTFLGMMVYFSQYVPFYSWIAQPFFNLLRKDTKWEWNELHDEAFDLCKRTLTNAPVRGYPIPGRPYRVYTDACDFGLAGILQQVQPIKIKDLRGTKSYERLYRAYQRKEPVPQLVFQASKDIKDVPEVGEWAREFEDTEVYIERVIAYWSRILKSAERNYSPTEREALALKEAVIKFQPLIEGEEVSAITDHAALTWSKTYQNVNRRLLTWGAVFSAYPKLKIVHRAGRVHSNVDPISRLRRRLPRQESPEIDQIKAVELKSDDPMKNMYEELGPQFEERLLKYSNDYILSEEEELNDKDKLIKTSIPFNKVEQDSNDEEATRCSELGNDDSALSLFASRSRTAWQTNTNIPQNEIPYSTSRAYSIIVKLSQDELDKWGEGYRTDSHFKKVLEQWEIEKKKNIQPFYPQYVHGSDGLIYFENWDGNKRICVPENLKVEIMEEVHNSLTETAHGGYHKCYNKIATTYYWPRMSRDIKRYVTTCDICQKAKPKRHAPMGLLQSIPIPSQPFEVVTMDFIPELSESNGYDNILVIVDKLTKYGIFIPCHTTIDEKETAKLFFKHVISKFGIPRQVISDRDTRWKNDFWKQICESMGMKRSLTTSYHPQADGQTEILNQTLEIALRCFTGPARDDWDTYLDGFALAYNSTPHTATGFSPAYLLRGYNPITSSTLIADSDSVVRLSMRTEIEGGDKSEILVAHEIAEQMVEEFKTERDRAKDAILLSQAYQKRNYNKGRLLDEFKEGDMVLLNPHSLQLLRSEKGRGQKLLMKYDGPFEVLRKLSPVTYQIRLPISYGMHPIINIAHLERYNRSPDEFGDRPIKHMSRGDFNDLPEYEIEKIVSEKIRKAPRGRKIMLYKVRWVGYGPEYDEWLTKKRLRNAPMILRDWEKSKGRSE